MGWASKPDFGILAQRVLCLCSTHLKWHRSVCLGEALEHIDTIFLGTVKLEESSEVLSRTLLLDEPGFSCCGS